jgi:hypothetical protein
VRSYRVLQQRRSKPAVRYLRGWLAAGYDRFRSPRSPWPHNGSNTGSVREMKEMRIVGYAGLSDLEGRSRPGVVRCVPSGDLCRQTAKSSCA